MISMLTNGTLMKVLKDATLSITQNCELSIKLCLDIDAYSTLKMKYTLFHNGFKMVSEEDDACHSKKTFTVNYELYGIPKTCPVQKVCLVFSIYFM